MNELSRAERYLINQIREGDSDAWYQLVTKYEGRLLAFATSRVKRSGDAEDLVQETFLQFLKGLESFREDATVETYLYTILRRRIADTFRGQKSNLRLFNELASDSGDDDRASIEHGLPAANPNVSWYARQTEEHDALHAALSNALKSVIQAYQDKLAFHEIKLADMVFFRQLRNKEAAKIIDMTEQQVALFKHRCIKRIRDALLGETGTGTLQPDESCSEIKLSTDLPEQLLTHVWENIRPSCPKRNTIGAFLLGTLDDDWEAYVRFHLSELECPFCVANRDDLQRQMDEIDQSHSVCDQIFQSTVGFFKNSGVQSP